MVLALLVEYGAVGLAATAIGLGIGRLLAPLVAESSVTLLGSPQPRLGWMPVAIVGGVAFVVVLLGTVRPAYRGIRRSTVSSLASGARPPKRPGRFARWADGIGAPLPAVYGQIRLIVIVTALLLVALGAINAFIVATFAARDGARSSAAIRAVGGTPKQTVVSSIVSQMGACALALTLGIPLGLGLWRLMEGGDLPETSVSPTALLLVATLVPIVFAAVVSIPARRLARRSIAPLLTYE